MTGFSTPAVGTLLRLDAGGALLSALLTGVFWLPRPALSGLPVEGLFLMTVFPVVFFAVDLAGLNRPDESGKAAFLKVTAMLNAGYALFTGVLLVIFQAGVTPVAAVYFGMESALVLALAAVEWRAARGLRAPGGS